MKQNFIKNLKDLSVLAEDNRSDLNEQLAQKIINFDPEIEIETKRNPAYWDKTYFDGKIDILGSYFTESLVSHLLEVKKHIQANTKYVGNVSPNKSISNNSKNVHHQSKEKIQEKPDISHFVPEERLKTFLAENKISSIRTYLMNKLNSRYITLDDLVKTIYYVSETKEEVFEEPKETAFVRPMELKDKSKWTEDYFSTQQVYLNQNFSLARILHLVNVRGELKGFDYIERKTEQDYAKAESSHHQSTEKTSSSRYEPPSQTQTERTQTTSSTQARRKPQSSSQDHSSNDFWKTIAFIGGAVLAAAVALFTIFK